MSACICLCDLLQMNIKIDDLLIFSCKLRNVSSQKGSGAKVLIAEWICHRMSHSYLINISALSQALNWMRQRLAAVIFLMKARLWCSIGWYKCDTEKWRDPHIYARANLLLPTSSTSHAPDVYELFASYYMRSILTQGGLKRVNIEDS